MTSIDTVSSRARRLIKPPLPYVGALIQSLGSQYDPVTRPDGDILMAVAENKLCMPLIRDKMLSANSSLLTDSTSIMNYTSSCGLPSFRAALSRFFAKYLFDGIAVDANNLVVGAGCVSGLITLSLLLFEAGDSVLIPAPYYPAFDADFANFGHVTVQPVHGENCTADVPFGYITIAALQAAHAAAQEAGHPPKAVLLSNPCNPLGTLYASEELLLVVQWCKDNNLHLIMDEIYALSVFPGSRRFQSIVSLLADQLGDRIHWLWSFSKDFGGSGIRAGVVYTQNASLLSAMSATNDAMMMSNLTQLALQAVIEDEAFVDEFVAINASRLLNSYGILKAGLSALNVHVLPAHGAIFAFADFSTHLPQQTFEAELALFHHMRKHGVLLTPGDSCHCPRPGFFRVCYAFVTVLALEEAFKRLKVAFETIPEV